MTAGSAYAQFVKDKRDWGLAFEDLSDFIEKWFSIIGAICIGLFIFGMPIFLLVVQHASLLNILS